MGAKSSSNKPQYNQAALMTSPSGIYPDRVVKFRGVATTDRYDNGLLLPAMSIGIEARSDRECQICRAKDRKSSVASCYGPEVAIVGGRDVSLLAVRGRLETASACEVGEPLAVCYKV
jgi:hypothetical protein